MCFSTARSESPSAVPTAALFLPWAISAEHLALAGSQVGERRGPGPAARGHEDLDHLRVDDRAAAGDVADGRHDLVGIRDPLLQQVGAALRAALRAARARTTGRRTARARPRRARDGSRRSWFAGSDALVGPGRRHPDVGHHHVGRIGLDRVEQRREVADERHDLDVGLRLEELLRCPPGRGASPRRPRRESTR